MLPNETTHNTLHAYHYGIEDVKCFAVHFTLATIFMIDIVLLTTSFGAWIVSEVYLFFQHASKVSRAPAPQ